MPAVQAVNGTRRAAEHERDGVGGATREVNRVFEPPRRYRRQEAHGSHSVNRQRRVGTAVIGNFLPANSVHPRPVAAGVAVSDRPIEARRRLLTTDRYLVTFMTR